MESVLQALEVRPSNQITFSLTVSLLQSGLVCPLQQGSTSSTTSKVTESGGLERERDLVTASIISRGAHSLYTSLSSSQSSLKLFTSMSGIFTKRRYQPFTI